MNHFLRSMVSRRTSKSVVSLVVNLVALSLYIQPPTANAEITAGIIVSPTSGLITDENGDFDEFFITLDSEPTHPVKITLETSDPTEGIVSSSSVTLNKNNYAKPKKITVIGLPDGIEDGDVEYQITGLATSSDPDFDGLVMPAVSVTNLNDPIPVASDDSATTETDTPVIIYVLDNDSVLDDVPINLIIESIPTNGISVVNNDNTITYTPDPGFTGDDQFSYLVCDSDGDCASATVYITVISGSVLYAADDRYSVSQDITLIIDAPGVLDNDTDPENKELQAINPSEPSHGELTLNPAGDFSYTPDSGFIGTDAFTYVASNGSVESDPATVIIDVLDETPPDVEWISPTTSGKIYDIYSDQVYLEVDASDNHQLNCIEFVHWDADKMEFVILGSDCDPAYAMTIESEVLNLGWNQIFAQAEDEAGNQSDFKHIWLYRMASIYLPIIGQ